MATTTPNFGWDIPQSTDLVKDGATAIAALGTDIDTALVDLKGGTTGQVLSKNSNTDLDFTWVAQDDSNAIQNALLTTTGDTIYASSASTPARLGIGTTGQVLTVSGGVPVWSTLSAGGMTLLSTTSLSGASTTISSISTDYTYLVAFIYGVTNATSDGQFMCDPNGSSNITNNHRVTGSGTWAMNTGVPLRFTSNLSGAIPLRANSNNVWTLTFPNYASTASYKSFNVFGAYVSNDWSLFSFMNFGAVSTSSAITSLKFYNDGGNLSTGTVLLYGVK